MSNYLNLYAGQFENDCARGRDRCGHARGDECDGQQEGPCPFVEAPGRLTQAQAAVLSSPDYARDMAHDGSELW